MEKFRLEFKLNVGGLFYWLGEENNRPTYTVQYQHASLFNFENAVIEHSKIMKHFNLNADNVEIVEVI